MRKTLLAPNEFRLTSLGLLNCRMKDFYNLALHVLYLSPGASDAAAGGPQANLSTLLGRSANSNAVVPIYTVTNFKQGNVISSAPLPTGPKSSANSGYSPLWQDEHCRELSCDLYPAWGLAPGSERNHR